MEIVTSIQLFKEAQRTSLVKCLRTHLLMHGTWIWSLGQKDPLEKELAAHSSILAWKTEWKEEPGRLQSMRPKRVRHTATHPEPGRFHVLVGSQACIPATAWAQEPRSPCSATKEATEPRSPHCTQLEKVQAQQQRPSAAKNKWINLKTLKKAA